MPEILQNIKAEDRLEKIRIVSENDDVIGGQPKPAGDDQNDNNGIFDLACSVKYSIEKSKNAQITADNADGKAVAAQNKANQVPNPVKDRFLVGNTTTAYKLMTVEQMRELIGINDDIPIGAIFEWDHEEAPKNYLFVRAQKFSDVEFPELAKLFPSLTLPDRRGVVSRGLDAGRGLDPNRVLGSYQEDAMQNIKGSLQTVAAVGALATSGAFFASHQDLAEMNGAIGTSRHVVFSFEASRSPGIRTAIENRMKNIATNYIIKAK